MRAPRLWEAILVVAIAGFMLYLLVGWVRMSCVRYGPRRRDSCLSNLKQLGIALKQYSQDYDERYPWRVGVERPNEAWLDQGVLFPNYCSAFKTFFCPSARDRTWDIIEKLDRPLEPFTSRGTTEVISYAYGIDARDTNNPHGWTENAPATVRLLADKKAGIPIRNRKEARKFAHGRDGRNVLYQDGHVKWKAGNGALDPDEEDHEVGDPSAGIYRRWWSDPPFYGE